VYGGNYKFIQDMIVKHKGETAKERQRPRYKCDIKMNPTKYDMSIWIGINWLKTVSRGSCSHVREFREISLPAEKVYIFEKLVNLLSRNIFKQNKVTEKCTTPQ
jgi:hypothetical protein